MRGISIIIPTLNEQGNIQPLLDRIHTSFASSNFCYEVLFIDDHSTDNTTEVINSYSETYPLNLYTKKGAKGKAQSILEGCSYAQYDILAFMDADLQYPPEALPKMMELVVHGKYDVVIGNRKQNKVNVVRKFVSKTCRYLLGTFLHGINQDIQSGQKVFKREILERIHMQPSPWSFDLEFLVKANQVGYRIGSVDIVFSKRMQGQSKIGVVKAAWEIGLAALKLKARTSGSRARISLR